MVKVNSSSDTRDYWENRLKENYSLDGTGFQSLGEHYNRWMYRIRKAVVRRSVIRTLSALHDLEVFDIGSGTGFYVEMWLKLGARGVTGSDITDVAVLNLRNKYPNNQFYRFDIGQKSLPDQLVGKKFGLVSAFDVLFHIVDDRKYLNAMTNINSLLETGGTFLFSDNFLHRSSALRSRHQVSRSLASIESTLQDTGFKVIDRFPMFVIMNAPVDTNNRLLPLTWRLVKSTARRGNAMSNITGCVLFPLELFLTSICKEGPSTEIMICKKV